MRHGNSYMIIDCVPADPKTPSGHKHNSRLSFELFAGDKSFIIDPGSYVYTADMEMRNLFRSTKYHNTVVVDDKEQNRFEDDELFAMNLDAAVNVNGWLVTENHYKMQRGRIPGISVRAGESAEGLNSFETLYAD